MYFQCSQCTTRRAAKNKNKEKHNSKTVGILMTHQCIKNRATTHFTFKEVNQSQGTCIKCKMYSIKNI